MAGLPQGSWSTSILVAAAAAARRAIRRIAVVVFVTEADGLCLAVGGVEREREQAVEQG